MSVNTKMKAIADEIRAKTGCTDPLTLDGMADNIPKVYASGQDAIKEQVEPINAELEKCLVGSDADGKTWYDAFWDACQNYGNRVNYIYGFTGASWNNTTLNPKYAITITGARGECMFLRCNYVGDTRLDMAEVCKKLDTSQATSGKDMFRDAYLENVTIDLGNATTIANCFNSGNGDDRAIKNVTLKVTEKCTAFTTAFSYCRETEEVIFTEDSVIAANGLNLQWSDKLSKESIVSIINALSTTTTGLTVTLSKTAVKNAFETSTGAADGSTSQEWADLIATKPNWTISLV